MPFWDRTRKTCEGLWERLLAVAANLVDSVRVSGGFQKTKSIVYGFWLGCSDRTKSCGPVTWYFVSVISRLRAKGLENPYTIGQVFRSEPETRTLSIRFAALRPPMRV